MKKCKDTKSPVRVYLSENSRKIKETAKELFVGKMVKSMKENGLSVSNMAQACGNLAKVIVILVHG